MKSSAALALALPLAVGLAACSGGSSSPSGRVCPLPTGATPQLLYPVPGATQVPDAVGILIYQGYTESTVTLVNGILAPVATTPTSVPTTLPSPIATPSNPNGTTTYAVSFPTLAAASLYSTLYALPAGCSPSTAQFGYFSTQ
jgi:hypothetical protein